MCVSLFNQKSKIMSKREQKLRTLQLKKKREAKKAMVYVYALTVLFIGFWVVTGLANLGLNCTIICLR
jgi:hypothetical protein